MPGPIHQGLLFLLKQNPYLVFDLAHDFDTQIPPQHNKFEIASNEIPSPAKDGNILHADWLVAAVCEKQPALRRVAGLAVEVQTTDDVLKLYSWLSYAAGVRNVFRCRGWTIVFAPDADVRRRAQNMFAAEPRASPWFVEPHMLPPIHDVEQAAKDIDRAVLTAVFHARSELGVACIRATLEAMRKVAHKHRRVYGDLMRAMMTEEQLEQIPERLFEIDDEAPLGPMELTGAYYVRGHREGREEGRCAEARKLILRVLERRSVALDEDQRHRIETASDLSTLETWLDRALTASSTAELFGSRPDDQDIGR
ncbi:hypothetical protein ENSA5_31210 [Enhygromyxa salina]|uniref:DUF4351 domain-containing protein n=2 Tax=Enhygromyxa salina TaxID=215803 RepID=A0A2S9XYE2_9BACT|nr:hypothetical protein ENSA5_31210 [Enhygromyxa salina]